MIVGRGGAYNGRLRASLTLAFPSTPSACVSPAKPIALRSEVSFYQLRTQGKSFEDADTHSFFSTIASQNGIREGFVAT